MVVLQYLRARVSGVERERATNYFFLLLLLYPLIGQVVG